MLNAPWNVFLTSKVTTRSPSASMPAKPWPKKLVNQSSEPTSNQSLSGSHFATGGEPSDE